ncbi:MAG: hypothetical protein G8345_18970, partial [Magnetococcales bacterium]|nr:hypothetical protein [Magnetococcales bacterium]NGZ28957.1 hypothetical protein [Magnetococcales bacterium]
MSPAILLRKIFSFFRYGRFVQVWFLPVWCLLGVSRAVILVIPFRRLAPKLGGATGVDPWVPILSLRQEGRARQISRVVQLAAGYTPWT